MQHHELDPRDPEHYQIDADVPLPGDDSPVPITKVQLQKVEAIVSAYTAGNDMWRDALPHVITFLKAAHMHDLVAGGHVSGIPTIEEAWAALNVWPWPYYDQTEPS
ncbi:hypothetical protein [Georgenia sp. SYP-B2076]|uniref:hypothetical protein n=1 Tax=Georgenia sp. SYP-B2076 TaxID=2495881 RepID=UPI000F8E0818|nr:hypothetical protein [Georgenia sp. SYP-B2076]